MHNLDRMYKISLIPFVCETTLCISKSSLMHKACPGKMNHNQKYDNQTINRSQTRKEIKRNELGLTGIINEVWWRLTHVHMCSS